MSNTIKFDYENDDGEEISASLPAIYEVCDRCHGEDKHVNPNIDGNGITSSEWGEWEPEEKESYMSGDYDVICEECKGLRVILVVDEENLSDEEEKLYEIYLGQQRLSYYDDDAERKAERRFGCG